MDQYSEQDVKTALEPYHNRIKSVVDRAFAECVLTKECRAKLGLAPLLYSRTFANLVFDAIAREAIAEFSSDSGVMIFYKPQTVKFCFGQVVIVRFKKANENGIGQNIPTQAALDFADPQESLPGLPPEAAKAEITWSPNELGTIIESLTVLARDGDTILWSYEIYGEEVDQNVTQFPAQTDPDDANIVPVVAVKNKDTDAQND